MSGTTHRRASTASGELRVAIVTVSDSRTLRTDESGALAEALTTAAGFHVTRRDLVRDEPEQIAAHVRELTGSRAVDAVFLTGGTGVAARDSTVEALTALFDRHLDGFGELFRVLSFAEVGAAAMLSRATGGTIGQAAVFAMPGSPAAVRLALDKLILPELRHLVGLLQADGAPRGDHAHSRDPHGHERAHEPEHGHGHRGERTDAGPHG